MARPNGSRKVRGWIITPNVAEKAGVSLTKELSKEDMEKLLAARRENIKTTKKKELGSGMAPTPEKLKKTIDIYRSIDERIERSRPKQITKGMKVVTASYSSSRDDYRFPLHRVVGFSRDGKTATIELLSLTQEQKEYKKINPTAYRDKVPVGSLFSPSGKVALLDKQRMTYMRETGNTPNTIKGPAYASQIASTKEQWKTLARDMYEAKRLKVKDAY